MPRRKSPSLYGSRNSSYASLGLRPPSGKASPNGPGSRSPSASPRPEHRRKSSISSLIAGALMPREKSPGPREEIIQVRETDSSESKSRKKEKLEPPPVASKPGWLKRTASAGKIMITGGSSKESSPVGSPLAVQPPSLPPRKIATSLSYQTRNKSQTPGSISATPTLPKRHYSPSASISIPTGNPAIHLDHRASLVVDLSDPLLENGEKNNLKTAVSFEDSLLPPPSRASVHLPLPSDTLRGHSLDAPRALSQVGSNGLTTVSPVGLATGLRTGLGVVNRRIGAWSQETSAASSTRSYLQAGGGAIGSAVTSGWSAFRNSKSSAPPSNISSSIGSIGGRSASNMSLATNSGAAALDMNGMDGPKIEPSLFKRHAPIAGVKGEVFGRDLNDAVAFWPVEGSSLQAGSSSTGRKRREVSLPAVALRCVDHRKPKRGRIPSFDYCRVTLLISNQYASGPRKRRVFSVYQGGAAILLS